MDNDPLMKEVQEPWFLVGSIHLAARTVASRLSKDGKQATVPREVPACFGPSMVVAGLHPSWVLEGENASCTPTITPAIVGGIMWLLWKQALIATSHQKQPKSLILTVNIRILMRRGRKVPPATLMFTQESLSDAVSPSILTK